MKILILGYLVMILSACTIGDFPSERKALYESNKPDCQVNPEKCIQGYPW